MKRTFLGLAVAALVLVATETAIGPAANWRERTVAELAITAAILGSGGGVRVSYGTRSATTASFESVTPTRVFYPAYSQPLYVRLAYVRPVYYTGPSLRLTVPTYYSLPQYYGYGSTSYRFSYDGRSPGDGRCVASLTGHCRPCVAPGDAWPSDCDHASSFLTTSPCTSVSRKSRPWKR